MTPATIDLGEEFAEASRARARRPLSQWVVEELTLPPGGPMGGRPFSFDFQPFWRLALRELERCPDRWREVVLLGPSQSGKTTLIATVIAHAEAELKESVIFGVPDLRMGGSKWSRDLKPILDASVPEIMPRSGDGSKGGKVEEVIFTTGSALTILSGQGGDKARAGYTAPLLVVTEADAFDTAKTTSREGTPIDQLKARTQAFEAAGRARHILECTVSTERGYVWSAWTKTTRSRIACRCPHCGEYVTPGRDDLKGWRDAVSVVEARQRSALHCPSCDAAWSEGDRHKANTDALLLHGDQRVGADGEVVGDEPATETLAFRWTASNNMFVTMAGVAAEEWKAANQAANKEAADRKMRQFYWAMPADDGRKTEGVTVSVVEDRATDLRRAEIPADTTGTVWGCDVRASQIHWLCLADRESGPIHVVDYGWVEVDTSKRTKDAVSEALDRLTVMISTGVDGRVPDAVGCDARFEKDAVLGWAARTPHVWGTMGYGAGRKGAGYQEPAKLTPQIRQIGDGWHVKLTAYEGGVTPVLRLDADRWKSEVHGAVRADLSADGALQLCRGPHTELGRHLAAEVKRVRFEPGKRGVIEYWEQLEFENHYLDCLAIAMAMMARLKGMQAPAQARPRTRQGERTNWVGNSSGWW